jgi:energy-coupling factor transporter ATP-binding protein EcfA2
MRLAALFIENHDYEFGGYTLNFGGHFYYEVKYGDGNTRITRTKNENFIDNFFDQNGILTNVSAIVGSNGSGKTTTINEALNVLNENYQKGIAFWEEKESTHINIYNTSLPTVKLQGDWETDFKQTNKTVGTIYYSPYLDHKIGVIGIDISADRYLREDLINLDSTFEASTKVEVSNRLKRADYKRFINFQKSEFSGKIKEKYGLFNDDMYRVVFTRHKINVDVNDGMNFENTPHDFQRYLNDLFFQIQSEYDSYNRSVSSDQESYELHKKLFKNILLMDLFCLLIKLMEKHNVFLKEGHFSDIKELNSFLETSPDATSKFKYWLNNYFYSKWNEKPLPNKEIIDILDFLYNYIDNLVYSQKGNYLNWSSKSLFFKEEKLNELLDLNENLLIALNKYYLQKEGDDRYEFLSVSELQYFVSVEFADRRLSSGETALLNLYSRIYDYFSRHIINYQVVRKEEYYILFLDEADLGYHPIWKKSFVNSIIEFSVDFFSKLGVKVQIVFTSHDAISLSDIPSTNVIYLHTSSPKRILDQKSDLRPKTTFAANINDLLAQSFFLEELLIGDFANSKIEFVINWINFNRSKQGDFDRNEFNAVKKIINIIEEPVLRNKLADMLSDVEIDDQFIQNIISKQTEYLRDILKRNK